LAKLKKIKKVETLPRMAPPMKNDLSGLGNSFVFKIGVSVISVAITYGAHQVQGLAQNVAELNSSVSKMLVRDESQEKQLDDLRARITFLERKMKM